MAGDTAGAGGIVILGTGFTLAAASLGLQEVVDQGALEGTVSLTADCRSLHKSPSQQPGVLLLLNSIL